MSNAERFLNAYARIERKLSEMNKDSRYVPFSQLLFRCSSISKAVSLNQQSLREYHELRNAIVHERGRVNEIIAEPCDSVTNDIERIAELLEADDHALQYASKHVRTVTLETSIEDVFHMMDEMKTSKIPVYEDSIYQGLVTLEEIARWGIEDNPNKQQVQDILISSKNEKVLFLSKQCTVSDVLQSFERAIRKGNSLLAIIITDKGSTREKPLGIITVYDLPNILKSFA